jgi:hypothetical protein
LTSEEGKQSHSDSDGHFSAHPSGANKIRKHKAAKQKQNTTHSRRDAWRVKSFILLHQSQSQAFYIIIITIIIIINNTTAMSSLHE